MLYQNVTALSAAELFLSLILKKRKAEFTANNPIAAGYCPKQANAIYAAHVATSSAQVQRRERANSSTKLCSHHISQF